MNIKIYRAQNEQKGWESEEIGYQVVPMPTKTESGYLQVCDYYAEVDGVIIPIAIERKSLQDAYGSFIQEKNRMRLYNEIMRCQDDERFSEFVIIVEATKPEFMSYYPFSAVSWHKARGSLKRFFGATKKKKVTVIEHLEERGAEIIFADSRRGAASVLSTLIAAHISADDAIEYESPDYPEVL